MDLTLLFSELYDSLSPEPFRSRAAPAALPAADKRAREVARAVLDEQFAAGETARRLRAGELEWDEHFSLVLGLDRAFAGVHPFLAGFRALPPELAQIRDRYLESGVLAVDGVRGQILPRLGAPGTARLRLESLADALRFVVRVPPEALKEVRLLCASNVAADGLAISRRELRVACAPMAESYEELEIVPTGTRDAPAYKVGPDAHVIAARLPAVLRELDDSGATIGFVPEATLDDTVLEAWKAAIRGAPAPSDSRLRWIVCGTGPVGRSGPIAAPNRAVVLDREEPDEPVWVQDKRFRYTIEPPELRDWRLEERLGRRATTEDIHSGDHTVVVDSSFGRVAITVCEDLGRLSKLLPPLEACGVSLILAPVFSKEVRQHFWEDSAGKFYVADGATVVVCNSRAVVTARALERELDADGQDLWGTSLARSPGSFQLELSGHPSDVRVLRFPIRIPSEPD